MTVRCSWKREVPHDPELRRLVEEVERQRDGDEKFHEAESPRRRNGRTIRVARGSAPTVSRCRQQRAHLARAVRTTRALVSAPAREREIAEDEEFLEFLGATLERGEQSFSSASCSVTAPSRAHYRRSSPGARVRWLARSRLAVRATPRTAPPTRHRAGRGLGRQEKVRRWIGTVFWPENCHASSAVKARIGASRRARASSTCAITACVARRRGESAASQ